MTRSFLTVLKELEFSMEKLLPSPADIFSSLDQILLKAKEVEKAMPHSPSAKAGQRNKQTFTPLSVNRGGAASILLEPEQLCRLSFYLLEKYAHIKYIAYPFR